LFWPVEFRVWGRNPKQLGSIINWFLLLRFGNSNSCSDLRQQLALSLYFSAAATFSGSCAPASATRSLTLELRQLRLALSLWSSSGSTLASTLISPSPQFSFSLSFLHFSLNDSDTCSASARQSAASATFNDCAAAAAAFTCACAAAASGSGINFSGGGIQHLRGSFQPRLRGRNQRLNQASFHSDLSDLSSNDTGQLRRQPQHQQASCACGAVSSFQLQLRCSFSYGSAGSSSITQQHARVSAPAGVAATSATSTFSAASGTSTCPAAAAQLASSIHLGGNLAVGDQRLGSASAFYSMCLGSNATPCNSFYSTRAAAAASSSATATTAFQ